MLKRATSDGFPQTQTDRPPAKRSALDSHRPEIEIQVTQETAPETREADAVVVGVFADGSLSAAAEAIDKASNGKIAALLARGDLREKPGSCVMLFDLPGVTAERVLLVSLGARESFGETAFRAALAGVAAALGEGNAKNAAVALADVDVPGRPLAWRLQLASRVLADGCYRFDAPKDDGDFDRGARHIELLISAQVTPELAASAVRGAAIAEGMALARDLGNLPGNICTPTHLADTARAIGERYNFKVDVLERADMEKLGMGSALSVGRSSAEPCKFIVMHYEGGPADAKPIVLVGKGVTFDTGGISLKPGADMDEMKFDMCGAASVLGAIKTAASLSLPLNLVGIVPAVENMPGGNATKPGDIVTSMSGQTIEILNTDAEGRLILCDALTYAERFDPECVIDVATLTGACVIALGNVASGLYANDDELGDALFDCGADSGDRAWRMPLFEEYFEQLHSNFADMSNLGGRPAGSVTAALFLSRYARKYKWAHLDIAGTNARSGKAKGATGRPVPLLSEFLLRRAERAS
jgi:leucyl aminopeptidase